MAELSLIEKKYKELIKSLYPKGKAWFFTLLSDQDKLLDSLAIEPARVEERADQFLVEMNPYTTFEMLDNWERFLAIPDECTPEGELTIQERRQRIVQKLTSGGGQSAEFYKRILQQLGYDVEIFDVVDYSAFRVGVSTVGQRLTNTAAWAFTFTVVGPATYSYQFRVGQNSVGDRLAFAENETLECVIRKYAPAHTTVLFAYE